MITRRSSRFSHVNFFAFYLSLQQDTLESDLRAAFAAHGSVSKVQMPTDRNTVRSLTLIRDASPSRSLNSATNVVGL